MESTQQNEASPGNRKRKCGPRVKTGCITCRIRRVKCDEGKPACQKCTSTGRKCDGYVQRASKAAEKLSSIAQHDNGTNQSLLPLSMIQSMPFSVPGNQREQRLFHFYCVQSAFDLSVYLNSSFWHNMILQYSEHHPVVRQAVVAFGASHVYAINLNHKQPGTVDVQGESYEQAKQYDKAIRALRSHMETSDKPDPHVVLICCALFFSCENGRGNREAALKHLERGLHILNSARQKQIATVNTNTAPGNLRPRDTEIDDELLYVFSRLDCQATLCQDTRVPVLNLDQLGSPFARMQVRFSSITDAQRSLDTLHNRLARFITSAMPHRYDEAELLPQWILEEKTMLDTGCAAWGDGMKAFIAEQPAAIRKLLKVKTLDVRHNDVDSKLAVQIQLLNLHHRCWWMLFLSSYPDNPSIFTVSPNPRAEEILDICEFLGWSLPLRPSVSFNMTEADLSWKLISEVGVTAPLFVLATKCTDSTVRARASKQLTALREHRGGVYDRQFLTKVLGIVEQRTEDLDLPDVDWATTVGDTRINTPSIYETTTTSHSPRSMSDSSSSQFTRATTVDLNSIEEPRELLGWSRRSRP